MKEQPERGDRTGVSRREWRVVPKWPTWTLRISKRGLTESYASRGSSHVILTTTLWSHVITVQMGILSRRIRKAKEKTQQTVQHLGIASFHHSTQLSLAEKSAASLPLGKAEPANLRLRLQAPTWQWVKQVQELQRRLKGPKGHTTKTLLTIANAWAPLSSTRETTALSFRYIPPQVVLSWLPMVNFYQVQLTTEKIKLPKKFSSEKFYNKTTN